MFRESNVLCMKRTATIREALKEEFVSMTCIFFKPALKVPGFSYVLSSKLVILFPLYFHINISKKISELKCQWFKKRNPTQTYRGGNNKINEKL